jgi:nucleotide-binding universal stress UspA family protein
MSSTQKYITVIINELNEVSDAAIHHSLLLAGYYNTLINIYHTGPNEKFNKLQDKSTKIVNVKSFRSYDDIVKSIENSKQTLLIILGLKTNGRKKNKEDIEQFNKILENISIPVVTIRHANFNKNYKHIILPLDLTKVTTQKVAKAIELSKLAGGAIINVLSVLFTDDQFDINRLTRQMIDVKSEIEKSGIECTAEIVKASPEDDGLGNVIIDYAHKSEADLIMIMSSSQNNSKKHSIDKDGWEIITGSNLPVMNIIPSAN